jgi:hypothetical protein
MVLDSDCIDTILNSLKPYPYGWRHELPSEYRFFGQRIAINIETRACPSSSEAPLAIATETDLLRVILTNFSEVLATSEREYTAYNSDYPELYGKVSEPRVWICREFQEREGPKLWTLSCGISDAPDWTIFVEFRELTFLEIWSGD